MEFGAILWMEEDEAYDDHFADQILRKKILGYHQAGVFSSIVQ